MPALPHITSADVDNLISYLAAAPAADVDRLKAHAVAAAALPLVLGRHWS